MENYFNMSDLNSSMCGDYNMHSNMHSNMHNNMHSNMHINMFSNVRENKHYLMLVGFLVVLVLVFYFGYFKERKNKDGKRKFSTKMAIGLSIVSAVFSLFVFVLFLNMTGYF